MNDATLLKLSVAVAIIGLVSIFLLSSNMKPSAMAVAQLNSDMFDQRVQISGTATSVKTTEDGNTFFTLVDETGKISIVAFASAKLQAPTEGANTTVVGRLQEYKGRSEVVAESITPS